MEEALFTLGVGAKRHFESEETRPMPVERHPPKQLEHLIGINDVRIAAELEPDLNYFYAAWELPALGWKYPIIPDALFSLGSKTFALEYDRGLENLKYFVGAKLAAYEKGLIGLHLAKVLVAVDTNARARTLSKAIGSDRLITVGMLAALRESGIRAFVSGGCTVELSSRENTFSEVSARFSVY